MGFIALVLTLVLEQLRPLPAQTTLGSVVEAMADGAEREMNAGRRRHGLYAWLLLVGGLALLVGLLYGLAKHFNVLLALGVNVVVLYLTMGFRQFSHPFTEIQVALGGGDLATARRVLTQWKREEDPAYDAHELPVEEVVRQAMERGVLLAHRHVFGVLFWFVLLPGPMGPVMYRLAEYVARRWNRPPANGRTPDRFGDFAQRAFQWIDWLPARMSALGFAIVGDFEATLYCWRQVARKFSASGGLPAPDSHLVILCAGSGALGTRMMTTAESAAVFDEPGNEGAGLAEPDPSRLRSGVALVWRALLLWLALLLLLSIAGWLA
jgi:adenosylcobinamide-phosphate synthase